MKNFKGNEAHTHFDRLIYTTLMACSLATVSIFASEMLRFSASTHLARSGDHYQAGNPSAKTNLADAPVNSVKTAGAPTNSFKPKAQI